MGPFNRVEVWPLRLDGSLADLGPRPPSGFLEVGRRPLVAVAGRIEFAFRLQMRTFVILDPDPASPSPRLSTRQIHAFVRKSTALDWFRGMRTLFAILDGRRTINPTFSGVDNRQSFYPASFT